MVTIKDDYMTFDKVIKQLFEILSSKKLHIFCWACYL